MNREVIAATLTRHDRAAWLAECKASVQGVDHIIADGFLDFQETRWNLAHSAEFVAWVDDDDRVVGDAIQQCVRALKETGAGVAFTQEARIDESGKRIDTYSPWDSVTLRDVAMHPQALHHLAVVRSSALAPEVLEQAQRIGIGIDWLMRAHAALRHGAVQVPMIGYKWRQHDGAESRTDHWRAAYREAMPALRAVTRQWMTYDAPIRQFLPR